MQNLYKEVMNWKHENGCELEPPAKKTVIDALKKEIGFIPKDLEEFYNITNGLRCDWFEILPIEDPDRPKQTWDGLKRANNIKTTKFFNKSLYLLDKFLIFSDIGGLKCAAFNRDDLTIWYEDEGKLFQTNLNLKDFINTMVLEVHNL